MNKRILIDILLFLSLFYAPWWMTAFLSLGFLLLFSNPFEVIIAGFFLDFLYGTQGGSILSSHIFFIIASCAVLVTYPLKEHLILELY